MAIPPRRGAPRGGTRLRRRATASAANAPRGSWARVTIFNFELGGATLFHRIQDYLVERFGLRYGNMHAILDWGCGAGRLLSYFQSVAGPQVWGSDIDSDNLAFCQKRLPFAHCVVFPLVPPTTLDASMFDLVIGISVCTHLSEQHQDQWLAELRRLCRPGGLVLLSVQGKSQSALYRVSAGLVRQLDQFRFVIKGFNPSINDLIGSSSVLSRCGADARPHPRALGSSFRGARIHRQPRSESGSRGDAGGQYRLDRLVTTEGPAVDDALARRRTLIVAFRRRFSPVTGGLNF